jgi:hypothetical protein
MKQPTVKFALILMAGAIAGCVFLTACSDQDEPTGAEVSTKSAEGRSDLVGQDLKQVLSGGAGVCRGAIQVGDATIGVGVADLRFSCAPNGKRKVLGARVIGLKVRDSGIIEKADRLEGFSDFVPLSRDALDASCSFLRRELDCEPAGEGALPVWPSSTRFSVLLELADPCDSQVLVSAQVAGSRLAPVSAAGVVRPPSTCQ